MKKLLAISLTVLLAALLIVSCSPEQKIEDELALISFNTSERGTRSLTRTNPKFDPEDFYWSYTAEKKDETGLITGTETTPKAVKEDKGLATVGPFSYGSWSFTLYGYADSARTELAYEGTSLITINKTTNTLPVTVESKSTGKDGYLEFPAKGTIALTGKNVTPDYTKLVEKIEIKSLDDEDAAATVEYDKAADEGKTTRTFKLKAGSYAVTVSYLNKQDTEGATDVIVYATDTIYVVIADYLTTKIGGDINENTGSVDPSPEKAGEVKVKTSATTIESGSATKIVVEAVPVSAEKTSTEDAAQNTTISIPSGALTGSSVSAAITSYTREAAANIKPTFSIKDTSGTTTEAAVLGGLDIDLYVDDSADKATDFSGDKALTITTYIATGLNQDDIVVKYDGPANEDGTAKSDGTVTSYEATSGKLTFTVDHLSSYYFVSKSVVVFNSTKKSAYYTLKDAIEKADSDNTLVFMQSVDLDSAEPMPVNKNITLDLNGKTITSKKRVFVVNKDILTVTNGTIEADISLNNGSSVIKVDCAEGNAGIVLKSDAAIKAPSSYGITAFGSANNTTLDIYGTIESTNPCIGGNGSDSYSGNTVTVNIYDGAVLIKKDSSSKNWTSDDDKVAVYQPNSGILNIKGGTITCDDGSAVEIRAGKATISGGTLSGSNSYSVNPNGSGTSVTGAAVAVSQHTTEKDIDVTISGGTFVGAKKLAVVDPEKNISDNVKVTVKNNAVADTDIVGIKVGDNTYYPTLESAVKNAAAGSTIVLFRDLDLTSYKMYEDTSKNLYYPGLWLQFKDNVTVDLNGHTIKSTNYGVGYKGNGLTLKNGKFEAYDTKWNDGIGSYAIVFFNDDSTSVSSLEATVENVTCDGGINVCSHQLVVKNSTITGTHYYALWSEEKGKITVESGTFTSAPSDKGWSVFFTYAEIVLKGGTFTANGDKINMFRGDEEEGGKITVEGGTFNYTVMCPAGLSTNLLSIYGGEFSSDPSTYLASGYVATESNSTWTVSKSTT